jgi:hypothetical protein
MATRSRPCVTVHSIKTVEIHGPAPQAQWPDKSRRAVRYTSPSLRLARLRNGSLRIPFVHSALIIPFGARHRSVASAIMAAPCVPMTLWEILTDSVVLNWALGLLIAQGVANIVIAKFKSPMQKKYGVAAHQLVCFLPFMFSVRKPASNPRPFALLELEFLCPSSLQSAEGRTFESHSGRPKPESACGSTIRC